MVDTCADARPEKSTFIRCATEITKQVPGILVGIFSSATLQLMFLKVGAALTMALPGNKAGILVVGVGALMSGLARATVAAMSEDERYTASLLEKFRDGALVGLYAGLYGRGLASALS